jgi:uncharacterized protein YjbI with pentapeptide repeats
LNLRSPTALTVIGVGATVILTLMVVITLLQTGGAEAVSRNAALIGALVGLGGVFTTQMVNNALEDRRAQEARNTEKAQRERELALEEQRTQKESLQAYLDQMGRLLLENDLRRSEAFSETSILARVRTLTVLQGLHGSRKGRMLQFLYESNLIMQDHVVIYLTGADLSAASLSAAYLSEADLSATNLRSARLNASDLRGANLSAADLSEADLSAANLHVADLSGADLLRADLSAANLSAINLSAADLSEAHLTGANLHKADLNRGVLRRALLSAAHLHEAELQGADLEAVHLEGANLQGAHLEGANLQGAHLEEAKLEAAHLEGATMPNGQKYEEWIKTRRVVGRTAGLRNGSEPIRKEICISDTPINVAYPAADELHLRIALGACRFEARPGAEQGWVGGTYYDPTGKGAPIIHTERQSVTITEAEPSFERRLAIFGGIPHYKLEFGKGRPFALTIDTGASEFDLDLGGVPLKALLVRQGAGRFNLNFSAPNPVAMNLLEVSGGVTAIELKNLANANFSRMRLYGGVAGYGIDFGGKLERDAEVEIETGLSGVDIAVPGSTAAKIVAQTPLGTSDIGDGFDKREGALFTEAGMAGRKPLLTIRAWARQGALQTRAT